MIPAAFALLAASLVLATFRVIRGPSLQDRVAALDLLGLVVLSILTLAAIQSGHPGPIDIVLVFTLLGFFGTVALARYLEKRRFDDD
jgi:multicomponent Na+:H+ antiporter subunit F